MKPKSSPISYLSIILILMVSINILPVHAQSAAALQDPSPLSQWKKGPKVPQTPKNPAYDEPLAGAPAGAGDPDPYGYTWRQDPLDTWVDASLAGGGTDTEISGDDQTKEFSIGFSFRYYGVDYDHIFINTNGMVSLGQNQTDYNNTYMPKQATPNNIIAVFWDDLYVGPNAHIYYRLLGTAPSRQFVIEWDNVTQINRTEPLTYTFELVLNENNVNQNSDIAFQYLSMNGSLVNATVGIEDMYGIDGYQCYFNQEGVESGSKITFSNPGSFAYISAFPLYNGRFTKPEEQYSFEIDVTNSGNLGADTYELAITQDNAWPYQITPKGSGTPLTNTNGVPGIDTGPIGQGQTGVFEFTVTTPADAQIGANSMATITVTSTNNDSKTKTISLAEVIPAPFAQIYRQNSDSVIYLETNGYGAGQKLALTPQSYNASNPGVIETNAHNLVTFWTVDSCLDDDCNIAINEIELSVRSSTGYPIRGITKLVNNGQATMTTQDTSPALAILPSDPLKDRIGVVWKRTLINQPLGIQNQNIFFAVLDPSGKLSKGPFNITNNTAWGGVNDPATLSINYPSLAVTGDNHFVLAWNQRRTTISGGYTNGIYTAVVDGSGGPIQAPAPFLSGSYDNILQPSLASLSNNRVLISWYLGRDSLHEVDNQDVYYNVLSSAGQPILGPNRNMSVDGTNYTDGQPDAVQLANGEIFVAWAAGEYITYDFLDGTTYEPINIESGLYPWVKVPNKYADRNDLVSVSIDSANHATISWTDYDWGNRIRLYYLLVDGGTREPLTNQPMISQFNGGILYDFNDAGFGNSSFSWPFTPASRDLDMEAPTQVLDDHPSQPWAINTQLWNLGFYAAETVQLTARVDSHIGINSITPAPNSRTLDASGNTVLVWNFPDIGYLDYESPTIGVVYGPKAKQDTPYTIVWSATTSNEDVNLNNNTATTTITFQRKVFLPIVRRR